MLLTIAIVLVVLWGLGLAMRAFGGIIHVVLAVAVVMFILHFARG